MTTKLSQSGLKATTETGRPALSGVKQPRAVRAVDISEYKAAALTLAEAFVEDDVGRYFLDTPTREGWTAEQKWDLHVSIFEYLTYAHIMCGLVTTAGDDYACVALWLPPGKDTDSFYTLLRSGMWRLHYQLCGEGRHRFFNEFFPLLHESKAAVMDMHDNDSWYLVYLGTKTSARGKGLARAVLGNVLDRADADGKCAYLESSNPVNLPFYTRLGFETKKTVRLSRNERGLSLDCMRREPRQATEKAAKKTIRSAPLSTEKRARLGLEATVRKAGTFAEKGAVVDAAPKTFSVYDA